LTACRGEIDAKTDNCYKASELTMRRYWVGNVAGAVACLGVIAGAIAYLSHVKRMPAPAMTLVQHLDEKLRYLRDHPEFTPELVAVGSSIAWRQLDGSPLAE
jgi:hypothetical protein